jgi:hypothetical protein
MRQQLEAMCSSSNSSSSSSTSNSSNFMAASSWPACRCLTTLVLDCSATTQAHQPSILLGAALQTPSLVDLSLTISSSFAAGASGSFHLMSRVTNLTQLKLHHAPDERAADADDSSTLQQLMAAVAAVRTLQQLVVSRGSGAGGDVALPCAPLARLPRLTQLALRGEGLRVDLQLLARTVPALKHLCLTGCTGVGRMASLFALTRLTGLEGPLVLQPSAAEAAEPAGTGAAAAGAAAGAAATTASAGAAATAAAGGNIKVPAAWRQGLRSLSWQGSQAAVQWPRVVPQLSSLTELQLAGACVSPDFIRQVTLVPNDVQCSWAMRT